MNKLRIGLFFNLQEDFHKTDLDPPDADAEWDRWETVQGLESALGQCGFSVRRIGDPRRLLEQRLRSSIDLVFSICEMRGGSFREALVPSLCEFLGIPYVFSSPDVLTLTLDKNLTNLIARQAGLPVPDWIVARPGEWNPQSLLLRNYPYVIKPVAEGSGMGIDDCSLVFSHAQLLGRARWVHEHYLQAAMVQEFVSGPEFTVSVLQKGKAAVPLCPLRVRSVLSNCQWKWEDLPVQLRRQSCDAVQQLAARAFEATGCRDAARVDIRLSRDLQPYVLEINPLPLLDPEIGYFSISAKLSGIDYPTLLHAIVKSACDRYGMETKAK